METPVELLRTELQEAFAGRTYPGDDRLALSRGDCEGYEGESVRAFFQGKHWRDLTIDSLRSSPDLDPNAFMAFMQADGIAYFLPGLLTLSLEPAGLFDVGEPVAFYLTRPDARGGVAWEQHFARLTSLLSPSEKQAVRHVLEHLASEYARRGVAMNQAQLALDAFWARAPRGR